MKHQEISFCFPAYNEENNIEKAIKEATTVGNELFDDYEIVVTDDGSQDNTAQVVQDLIKANPKIKLIQQENQGYGASVWTAISNASKNLIFFTDADLQFNIDEIRNFLPFVDNYDVIIGFRQYRADPLIRRLNAWGWTKLINQTMGLKAKDIDCAFKLIKKIFLNNVEMKSKGATFSAELLWRLKLNQARFKQLPVKHLPRTAGRATGANLKVIIKAFKELQPLIKEKKALNRHSL